MPYLKALAIQQELVADLQAHRQGHTLLLVEHHPAVITMGRRAKPEHLLADRNDLARRGVEVVEVSRGGDITCHGPGQVVAYPIVRLDDLGLTLRQYVAALESAIMETLAGWGVVATRREGLPGVWVGPAKIAAIGVAVSRWVTWHGLALNVSPQGEPFGWIVPCGLAQTPITSVEQVLGRAVDLTAIKQRLAESIAHRLGLTPEPIRPYPQP